MQKITPFLWFDTQAEEAANFYVSVFNNSSVGEIARAPVQTDAAATSEVLVVTFTLEGQQFHALNGGPSIQFNPAVSLLVSCESQAEVDNLWDKLTTGGGKPVACGWLTDKYGLSWQICPTAMLRYLHDNEHPEKSARAFKAMMEMTKLDLAALERAYEGE